MQHFTRAIDLLRGGEYNVGKLAKRCWKDDYLLFPRPARDAVVAAAEKHGAAPARDEFCRILAESCEPVVLLFVVKNGTDHHSIHMDAQLVDALENAIIDCCFDCKKHANVDTLADMKDDVFFQSAELAAFIDKLEHLQTKGKLHEKVANTRHELDNLKRLFRKDAEVQRRPCKLALELERAVKEKVVGKLQFNVGKLAMECQLLLPEKFTRDFVHKLKKADSAAVTLFCQFALKWDTLVTVACACRAYLASVRDEFTPLAEAIEDAIYDLCLKHEGHSRFSHDKLVILKQLFQYFVDYQLHDTKQRFVAMLLKHDDDIARWVTLNHYEN